MIMNNPLIMSDRPWAREGGVGDAEGNSGVFRKRNSSSRGKSGASARACASPWNPTKLNTYIAAVGNKANEGEKLSKKLKVVTAMFFLYPAWSLEEPRPILALLKKT